MNYLFRSRVLMRAASILSMHAGEEYGIEELAQLIGAARQSVATALEYLEADGLVRHRTVGKKNLYTVAVDHPFYPEVRSVALKTFGGSEEILRAILDDQKVFFAAIFGSFARGEERLASDLDVLFVIDDDGQEEEDYRLAVTMVGIGSQIARQVNPSIYSRSEFQRLISETNATLQNILAAPMIVLKGDISDVA